MKNSIGTEKSTLVRAARRGVRVGLAAAGDGVRRGDHHLLRRPDHEPDVVPHQCTQQAAGQDARHVAAGQRHALVAELGQQDQPAGQEGEHRAPAEPPEGARHQPAHHRAARRAAELGAEEGRLHEVEVVEDADPGDAGHEMQPAEQEVPAFHAEDLHARPPLRA
jgi:hypothetical protein